MFSSIPNLTPRDQLALNEEAVAKRKLQIAHFGSTWIRPVGVQKTLHGELEEIAEREDADAQSVPTVAHTQDNNINHLLQHEVAAEVEDEEGGTQRDLDVDIPEAGNLDADEEDLDTEEVEDEEDDPEEEDDEEEDEPQTPPPRVIREGSQGNENVATGSNPRHAIISNNHQLGPQGDQEVMNARLRAYHCQRGAPRGFLLNLRRLSHTSVIIVLSGPLQFNLFSLNRSFFFFSGA
ncbi:hypothetical protein RUND412_009293 [Rhizina undulata]